MHPDARPFPDGSATGARIWPSGIGPRDLTLYNFNGTPGDALGGTMYWGASLEFQTPIYFAPKEIGIKLAAFVDAGSLWNYRRPDIVVAADARAPPAKYWPASSNNMFINSSVGVGLLWASPFGPIRFDLAYPADEAAIRPQADGSVSAAGRHSDLGWPAAPRLNSHERAVLLSQRGEGLTVREIAALTGARAAPRRRS